MITARRFCPLPRFGSASKTAGTMKPRTLQATVLLATISIGFVGCENLSPGENAAVFGGASAVAASTIARAAGMNTAGALATGAAVGAVVAATTYVIAKHQASERQRALAEQRARVYYARLSTQKKATLQKKRVRYIAVDTAKDQRTSPKAQKSVMLWDTQSQSVVGNNVYDVESAPEVGSTAKFETYSAEYVGSGS